MLKKLKYIDSNYWIKNIFWTSLSYYVMFTYNFYSISKLELLAINVNFLSTEIELNWFCFNESKTLISCQIRWMDILE